MEYTLPTGLLGDIVSGATVIPLAMQVLIIMTIHVAAAQWAQNNLDLIGVR